MPEHTAGSGSTAAVPSIVGTESPSRVDLDSTFRSSAKVPDPRTIIIVLLIINATVLASTSQILAYAAVLLAVVCLATVRPRYALTALTVAAIGTGIALAAGIWPNPVFVFAGVIGHWTMRFTATVAFAVYALIAIRPTVLVAALRRARCPRFIVVPVTVIFRMFPTILREAAAVRDAMTLRGLHPDPLSFLAHPIRTGELLIIPLLTSVIRSGDELTAAALVRGLGRPERPSSVYDLRFSVADLLLGLAGVGLLTLALTTGGRAG
ncbi:energy-coupling factor transporter transmembrane protein EcfT [Brevibacterium sediminis]|uniref:energy-coupling factor transporter transmembrane component T n=1 Tax=Brevibacterium sediminis TaxID=1857024 RepID=UPI0021756472|nr:energy-coupling factor transporter transmembrane component T [Brevibacterium sediminis]MCS4592285.1 energy-coupling factor transporter transmembrane protein EcfT [Brevibacterium sediminis]